MIKQCYDRYRERKGQSDYIQRIHVREDQQQVRLEILRKRIRILLILTGALLAVWMACRFLPSQDEPILRGSRLIRQEEDTEIELQIQGQTKGENWSHSMTIPVASRQFSKEERDRMTAQAEAYLLQRIAGENASLDEVNRNLFLPTGIPGTGAEIDWTVDPAYLDESGKLLDAELPETGADTELMAKVSWKNWSAAFYFPIHLTARKFSEKERAVRRIEETLRHTVAAQGEEREVVLPDTIGGVGVTYAAEGGEKNFLPAVLILGLIVLLPVLWRQQEKNELVKRDEQLLDDYPALINKFMLLLGAGLTVRNVVERLTMEYEQGREKGGEKRYAYEELCVMAQEIKDGVSERRALEDFGKKCRLLPYLRFSSIMAQNLKKGAEGILELLEKESMEAMEKRKERVLQLGEKAGTKLLFPMMLQLGIVMAVIMVPAFMTM